MVTSIILFKLKEKSNGNCALLEEKLLGMRGKIDQLKSITTKTHMNIGSATFDLMMTAQYNSKDDFAKYLVHPIHVDVKDFVLEHCEEMASFQYED